LRDPRDDVDESGLGDVGDRKTGWRAMPRRCLLGEIVPELQALVEMFLDRPELRAKLAVCDLELLERLGTVRSSAFVYFEWFLRDAYGVKLMPVPAFTQGLIDRGIISLGM